MHFMNTRSRLCPRKLSAVLGLLLLLEAPGVLFGEPPPPSAVAAFESYALTVEARLARQHGAAAGFLSLLPAAGAARLQRGEPAVEPVVEPLSPPPSAKPAGALLHHWRATAFVPDARAAGFEQLLRNFDAYPRVFAPQVIEARTLVAAPDHLQASLRVRQRHVLTVVLDTTYEVTFGRLDPRHAYSSSRSLHIAEVTASGVPTPDHGFLWRQNTYWSWEERDGGLYLQVESVSLTRAIPAGLGWAVGPYAESIPRESLEFTLRAAAAALRRPHSDQTQSDQTQPAERTTR